MNIWNIYKQWFAFPAKRLLCACLIQFPPFQLVYSSEKGAYRCKEVYAKELAYPER